MISPEILWIFATPSRINFWFPYYLQDVEGFRSVLSLQTHFKVRKIDDERRNALEGLWKTQQGPKRPLKEEPNEIYGCMEDLDKCMFLPYTYTTIGEYEIVLNCL